MEKGPKLKSGIKRLALLPDGISAEAIAIVADAMVKSHTKLPPEEAENRAVLIFILEKPLQGDEFRDLFTTGVESTSTEAPEL